MDEGLAEFRGNEDEVAAVAAAVAAVEAAGGAGPSNVNNNKSGPGGSSSSAALGARRSTRLSKKLRSGNAGDETMTDADANMWFCETCTFVNEQGGNKCEMCQQPRGTAAK